MILIKKRGVPAKIVLQNPHSHAGLLIVQLYKPWMEMQLENKTRITIEEGCLRPYQYNFEFSNRVGRSHKIMILVTVSLQNIHQQLSKRVSPSSVDNLVLLFFRPW